MMEGPEFNIPCRDFVCCLSPTLDFTHNVVQAQAVSIFPIPKSLSFYDLGAEVDMYRASFTCRLPTDVNATSRDDDVTEDGRPPGGAATLKYVAFAQRSCDVNMTYTALRVEQPDKVKGKVALCSAYMFGQPNLERLVEWMELARLLGVSRVQIFHSGLSEGALNVLRHYSEAGLVLLLPVTIPHRLDQPPRDFTGNTPQQWQDKDVLLEDCMHRLSHYDFVIHLDQDELFVPSPAFASLHAMLQAAVREEPRAAAFHHNLFLSLNEWPETDPARPITFLRRLERTVNNTLDNELLGCSSPKLVYRPDRVGRVSTHHADDIRPGSTVKDLPDRSYRSIHYRACKPWLWKTCEFERKRDVSLLRFESQWLAALAKLPLAQLGLSEQYISAILRATGGNSTSVEGNVP